MTAEALALFPDLPAADREHYRRAAAALAPTDHSDRAAYVRAKATGARWRCPSACTEARGDECACPCGRRCHGAAYCGGH
jgi:hypothetical protein